MLPEEINHGYVRISVDGKMYYRGRLAVLYMTGTFPPPGMEVDHIDHDRGNDRWANLRVSTKAENGTNRPIRRTNKSGITGVHWDAQRGKWFAAIHPGRRTVALGRFDTIEEATAARNAAEAQYHARPEPRGRDKRPLRRERAGSLRVRALNRTVRFPPNFICHRIRDCTGAVPA